jgi:hypothetical protein
MARRLTTVRDTIGRWYVHDQQVARWTFRLVSAGD